MPSAATVFIPLLFCYFFPVSPGNIFGSTHLLPLPLTSNAYGTSSNQQSSSHDRSLFPRHSPRWCPERLRHLCCTGFKSMGRLHSLRLSGLADRMMALLDQVEEWSARMGWDSSMVGLVIGADGFVRWAIRNAGGSSASWDIYFIAQLAELVESPEKVRRWYRTVEGWVRNGRAVMNRMKVRTIGSEGRVKQERESELTFPDEKIE
uniref:Uncharacterized protein n=1 Tax=Globodera rostochiensis TaxID=31243 RepID=A0A914IDE6_GLORO